MHCIDNLLARASVRPRAITAAACAHFGHDHEIVRVWMKGLFDELVGDVRTIKVTGINMVYARGDDLTQNSDRTGNVGRGAPDEFVAIPPSQLHGAVAH